MRESSLYQLHQDLFELDWLVEHTGELFVCTLAQLPKPKLVSRSGRSAKSLGQLAIRKGFAQAREDARDGKEIGDILEELPGYESLTSLGVGRRNKETQEGRTSILLRPSVSTKAFENIGQRVYLGSITYHEMLPEGADGSYKIGDEYDYINEALKNE